mmetsp:Transcript_26520/g.79515  ORF Transcript_26520/g.79515 Transcript_26520/m.79515 type:complete len:221 (+) Transcript_26520:703-1365(+)
MVRGRGPLRPVDRRLLGLLARARVVLARVHARADARRRLGARLFALRRLGLGLGLVLVVARLVGGHGALGEEEGVGRQRRRERVLGGPSRSQALQVPEADAPVPRLRQQAPAARVLVHLEDAELVRAGAPRARRAPRAQVPELALAVDVAGREERLAAVFDEAHAADGRGVPAQAELRLRRLARVRRHESPAGAAALWVVRARCWSLASLFGSVSSRSIL